MIASYQSPQQVTNNARSRTQMSFNEYSTQPTMSGQYFQDSLEEHSNFQAQSKHSLSSQKQTYFKSRKHFQLRSNEEYLSNEMTDASPMLGANSTCKLPLEKCAQRLQMESICSKAQPINFQLLSQFKVQLMRDIKELEDKARTTHPTLELSPLLDINAQEDVIQEGHNFYQDFRSNFCIRPTQFTKAIKEITKQHQLDQMMSKQDDEFEDLRFVFSPTAKQSDSLKEKQNYVKLFLNQFKLANNQMSIYVNKCQKIVQGHDKLIKKNQNQLDELQKCTEVLKDKIGEQEILEFLLSK